VAEANATISGHLFAAAKTGNITAIIFWLKTRAHWSERTAPGLGRLSKKSMKFPVFSQLAGNFAETSSAQDYPLHRRVNLNGAFDGCRNAAERRAG
jgi:hypothetical protein